MKRLLLISLLLSLCSCSSAQLGSGSWGSGTWGVAGVGKTVTISPNTVTLNSGASASYSCTTTGNLTANTCTYTSTCTGGSLNASTGAFVAGNGAQSCTVTATGSDSTTTSVGTVSITVVGISIDQGSTYTTTVNATVNFTATVTGAQNTGKSWSCTTGGGCHGSIVAGTGVYTAPASANTDTIVATSSQDGTKTASTTVTVNSSGLALNPASISVYPTNTTTFTATGGTAPYTYSILTANCSGGAVNSGTGIYTAQTNNGNATTGSSCTDTIKVTDNVAATATATVTVNPGTVYWTCSMDFASGTTSYCSTTIASSVYSGDASSITPDFSNTVGDGVQTNALRVGTNGPGSRSYLKLANNVTGMSAIPSNPALDRDFWFSLEEYHPSNTVSAAYINVSVTCDGAATSTTECQATAAPFTSDWNGTIFTNSGKCTNKTATYVSSTVLTFSACAGMVQNDSLTFNASQNKDFLDRAQNAGTFQCNSANPGWDMSGYGTLFGTTASQYMHEMDNANSPNGGTATPGVNVKYTFNKDAWIGFKRHQKRDSTAHSGTEQIYYFSSPSDTGTLEATYTGMTCFGWDDNTANGLGTVLLGLVTTQNAISGQGGTTKPYYKYIRKVCAADFDTKNVTGCH